ncbi:hypothetical protein CFC21_024653 [Triticum aestivum]|uniref:VOC domain-containing protein n=2 Tax=Triticum aestivum TaxID=4565 RepID=A0A9R1JB10_WHEAT|nr:metallothiol transferase FosB-like [Triticum aestivum]KAF7010207.1 hypothetical protein CFC21_024653 [Triticum aestivum]
MGLPAQEQQREPEPALPLVRLNHVAFSCASVEDSIDFYRRVLGFQLIQRPASLDFGGAWMHRDGMGIHLLQRSAGCDAPPRSPAINPKGNHISFQCTDMALTKARLRGMNLDVVTTRVWDGETTVEQLFFHDPDGNVIEICNCEDLPVVPLAPPACLAKQTVQMNVHLYFSC